MQSGRPLQSNTPAGVHWIVLRFSSLLQSGMTPLHYASQGGHLYATKRGRHAIKRGHHDTVQVLLEHHADVNARDEVGPYTDMYIYISRIFADPSTMGMKL